MLAMHMSAMANSDRIAPVISFLLNDAICSLPGPFSTSPGGLLDVEIVFDTTSCSVVTNINPANINTIIGIDSDPEVPIFGRVLA